MSTAGRRKHFLSNYRKIIAKLFLFFAVLENGARLGADSELCDCEDAAGGAGRRLAAAARGPGVDRH